MAIEYKTITYRTCEGLDNLRFSWCELSKSHVSQRFGTIKQISIPNRLENENYLCTEPRYLGVWERAENGELVHLGNSKNTVTQELGRVSVWEFDSVKNTGNGLVLALLATANGTWADVTDDCIGGRGNADDYDGCILFTPVTNEQFNNLPDITFTIEYAEVVEEPDEPEIVPDDDNRRIIDISNYWIPIIRQTEQFKQIATAENPEFNKILEYIYRIVKESFILESTEYGVKRWETILGIVPTETMTLDERKTQILNYLNIRRSYTIRTLRQMLAAIVGEGNFTMSIDNDTQILDIQFNVIARSKVTDVQQLLGRVLPMNLDLHMLVDGVPPQYTTLEYLESSGTQYFLIDESFKKGTGVYVDVHLTDSRLAQNGYYLYFYNLLFNSTYRLYAGLNGTARYIHNDEYGNYGSLLRAYSADGRYSFGYNFRNSGQKILNTSAGTYTQAITAGYVKSSSKFPMLGIWREYEKTSAPYTHSQRVFSLQMTQGDVMTRDLVPVLNADGVPGMYDKVSKTFIANAGSGTFGYRVKTPASDTMRLDLDDPYYTAPSGVWAKVIAENTLDIIADTDLADGTTQGYTWFANSGDAYQYFNIEEVNEND